MNEGLRPYPEYKDSNLLWLGALPTHWDVRRNGRLFAQRNETGFGSLPILEVSLKTGVRVRDMENMKRKQVMTDREKYKRAAKGDIAYNMMRMWQGALGAVPVDGLVSPAYVVARPFSGTETRYFSYLFRTAAYMAEVDGYSRGIVKDRNRLYWEDFKRMPSCYPMAEEQTGIADYLDANALLVRKFIRNRRRLIEVLNERKQAIINDAVTRGLEPNIRLKHSGVDGLGDVPESWRVLPLKRWVTTKITDGPHETPPLLDDGIDFVSAEAMVDGKIVFERRRGFISRHLHELYCAKCRPQRDDIFMCKSGNTTGKVALVDTDREFSVWSPLALIRCRTDLAIPKLLFLVLASNYVQQQVLDRASYGTQPNLSMAAMERITIALPAELSDQEAVLCHIESKTHRLDAAISRAFREIDLVHEYRTRLIADVVTGKLDVRHVAPPAGEELDEIEELDAEEALDDELEGAEEGDMTEEALDADD